MNISDLIVSLLEKGQRVEIPGIGTLESVVREAHHDPSSATFFPASRTIAYRAETSGDESIIKSIAEADCVKEEVARQMWHNYIDALTDKLRNDGEHQLGRLGRLTCEGKKTFGFTMAEDVTLDAGNKDDAPIAGVRTYSHEGEADPFAQYADEVPIEKVVPGAEPVIPSTKPEPPAATPAAPQPPTPEESAEMEQFQTELDRLDKVEASEEMRQFEERQAARDERNRIKHQQKAEREQKERERKAEEERKRAEALLAKEREAEKRKAEELRRKEEEALRNAERRAQEEQEREARNAEENRIRAEKKAAALAGLAALDGKPAPTAASEAKTEAPAPQEVNPTPQASEQDIKRQQKEAAKQQKAQAKQEAEAAKAKAKQEAEAAKAKAKQEAAAAKAKAKQEAAAAKAKAKAAKQKNATADAPVASPDTAAPADTKGGGKKRRSPLVPLLIILILLLGGALAYLLLYQPTPAGEVAAAHAGNHLRDVADTNCLTFNCDMIDYSEREILAQREQVCCAMEAYVGRFLADCDYRNAKSALMGSIRQYAGQRLGELLGDRFAVQRLIPYDDYIYSYNLPYLKRRHAYDARHIVQGELMDGQRLDEMLEKLVDELGLEPGNTRRQATEGDDHDRQTSKAKRQPKATAGDAPAYVYVVQGSKKGYDVIAGFYRVKDTAAKMTARLSSEGCDAYIIELDGGFYVSMGSAATQTAAEALLKHIESWYKGAVVVKKL